MLILEPGLSYSLQLTQAKDKIRVKERSVFSEYGIPVSTRKNPISSKCYVEWQIGYDATLKDINDGIKSTTLIDDKFKFVGANNRPKLPYELSEILYYSFRNGFIDADEIKTCYDRILAVNTSIETREDMQITRTNPIIVNVEDFEFYKMQVTHPLLVHRFGKYEIYAEILINEKQFAVGSQPMLYVCLPIDLLSFETPVIGRSLEVKETAKWVINKEEAKLALELFKVFALLSDNHKQDISEILKVLFPECLNAIQDL